MVVVVQRIRRAAGAALFLALSSRQTVSNPLIFENNKTRTEIELEVVERGKREKKVRGKRPRGSPAGGIHELGFA